MSEQQQEAIQEALREATQGAETQETETQDDDTTTRVTVKRVQTELDGMELGYSIDGSNVVRSQELSEEQQNQIETITGVRLTVVSEPISPDLKNTRELWAFVEGMKHIVALAASADS